MILIAIVVGGVLLHFFQAAQTYVLAGKRRRGVAYGAQFHFFLYLLALELTVTDLAVLFAFLNVIQFATGAFDQLHVRG